MPPLRAVPGSRRWPHLQPRPAASLRLPPSRSQAPPPAGPVSAAFSPLPKPDAWRQQVGSGWPRGPSPALRRGRPRRRSPAGMRIAFPYEAFPINISKTQRT